jgi:hypothetical protein
MALKAIYLYNYDLMSFRFKSDCLILFINIINLEDKMEASSSKMSAAPVDIKKLVN